MQQNFHIRFKNALQGYTSANYDNLSEYQAHLTTILIEFRKIEFSNPEEFTLLNSIVIDFVNLDHCINSNWKIIKKMIHKEYWKADEDFAQRITGSKNY